LGEARGQNISWRRIEVKTLAGAGQRTEHQLREDRGKNISWVRTEERTSVGEDREQNISWRRIEGNH
jgi:hypothetical protein